jgi:hypothetical protein
MRSSFVAAVLVLAVPALQAAGAATLFRTETRQLDAKAPVRDNTLLADGQRMRLDAGDSSVVFLAGTGSLYVLDHSDHSYVEIDRNAMQSVAKSLGEAKAEMRERLATLPPERREKAEKLLADSVGPDRADVKTEVRPTGRKDRIAGIPCTEVELLVDGKKEADVCRASFAAAHVPRKDLDAVRELVGMLRNSVAALAPESLREGGLDAIGTMEEVDSLPLRMRTYRGGEPVLETRMLEVKEEAAPASAFEVPAGYHPRISIQVRKGPDGSQTPDTR